MNRMKRPFFIVFFLLFLTIHTSFSFNRGFPFHMTYENCIKPSNVTQFQMDSTISSFYWYWKDKYIKAAGSTPGGYYLYFGQGTGGSSGQITISEAHGYGMIIFALLGGEGALADSTAKTYFDGMYKFYDDHRSSICQELMSWEVLTDGQGGESDSSFSAATDGDMDIAYALLLAHYQWGSNGEIDYLGEAQRIITYGIKKFETNPENYRIMLGDWVYWFDSNWTWEWVISEDFEWATRSSDWMVAHLKAYEDITGDSYWGSVRDEIYNMIDDFVPRHSPNTGLLCDFIDTWNTEPAGENYLDEFKETDEYYQNACRTPLRFVADWAHYNNPKTKPFLNKILNWLRDETNERPDSILFGYDIWTGKPLFPDSLSMCFTAPFIAASIVDSSHQQYLDDGWAVMAENRDHYYPDCLNLMSMLMISGNWWAPKDSVKSDPVIPVTKIFGTGAWKLKFQILNNKLLMFFDKDKYLPEKIEITSLNGRQQEIKIETMNKNYWEVDLSEFARGSYIIAVTAEGRKLRKNIILMD